MNVMIAIMNSHMYIIVNNNSTNSSHSTIKQTKAHTISITKITTNTNTLSYNKSYTKQTPTTSTNNS